MLRRALDLTFLAEESDSRQREVGDVSKIERGGSLEQWQKKTRKPIFRWNLVFSRDIE